MQHVNLQVGYKKAVIVCVYIVKMSRAVRSVHTEPFLCDCVVVTQEDII